MFFSNATPLPVWAWVVIGLLSVIGIVIGFWGFLSGFKLFSKLIKEQKINQNPLSVFEKIDLKNLENFKDQIGVVGIYFNSSTDDFFKPIFVDTTNDISNWVITMKKEIEENQTIFSNQVNTWLSEKKVEINNVNYVCVEKTKTLENAIIKKDDLLNKLNLSKRMFER